MEHNQITPEWIEEQRQISEIVDMVCEDAPGSVVPLLKQIEKSQTAALDALEAARKEIARLTAERDAALADGEKAKQYWLQANDERDAAINDLTTAMVDMYIEGRGDETHICWACAHAKQYKDRYPCSSCINYEMAEFVHRGVCAENTDAPTGAESEGEHA